jgi:hypothetical protein
MMAGDPRAHRWNAAEFWDTAPVDWKDAADIARWPSRIGRTASPGRSLKASGAEYTTRRAIQALEPHFTIERLVAAGDAWEGRYIQAKWNRLTIKP